MTATADQASSETLERDARVLHADEDHVRPGEIAIGVIIGRTTEFFDFFVYAIASVLVFPSYVFPYVDPLTGTLYSFALFSLAFFGRPLGTFLFTYIDQHHGRGVKLTIALFLLGGSTMAIALLPSYAQVGATSAWLLGLFRLLQGVALGGAWDGLPSLLALNSPRDRRGWYSMIPQIGAPLGLALACGLFAYFVALLEPADFLSWGWRYPFFVALALNIVALFARLRLVATPEFKRLFDTRELQPSPPFETLSAEWRTILLGAFAPLASFALFHLVAVFPLSYNQLFTDTDPVRFLIIEGVGALICVLAIVGSGVLADRVGRRAVLGVSAALIGAYSGFAPQLLGAGQLGEAIYLFGGFVLLGLAFGQSSGAVNSSFSLNYRYTGAAIVSNSAWFIGAGFAPLVALWLTAHVGLWAVGLYLLSGVICTLGALLINREWGLREAESARAGAAG
ncbi:MFS transporter [Sphingomonas astaxanthinifaciens]|uniref:MFS transporter n=1 Tax=Sphingomonas astaxanthinifaciens DSM 22298 TaxID=1123267 RepID=A0ABQ5Z4Q0_9SPHN|nr:MFS transporter [Sphingomonas astaxanthinifaciens]GLR47773.1 MFS transporter [Sphingomonas astaxanthinifaciens DSM 22298]